ncbi:hypothetical protein [Candidatus Methylobacter oryzae]|uniref:Uncharacterized protein n=1 Tax=Candidatus Methylobacter oryzae TaxID=2497749 RepID=A0ABY3CAB9_9GAMM|nr:hypothetical protein [Candidatus Methylobacter oryzae]TRW94735.1 hypothetical protein EKO24_010990 [Candidatus Methylobacter oryzae]
MPSEKQRDDQPLPSTDAENLTESVVGNFKMLLLFIGGVALVLSILVLLPMFLTYLSEGDYRAPSEVHPTDSAVKRGQSTYKADK